MYVMLVSLYPYTLFVCVRIRVRGICVLAYSSVSLYVTLLACLPVRILVRNVRLLAYFMSIMVASSFR